MTAPFLLDEMSEKSTCLAGRSTYVARESGGFWKRLPGPAEFRPVAPHAMHDYRQTAAQSDNGLLLAALFGDAHDPSF